MYYDVLNKQNSSYKKKKKNSHPITSSHLIATGGVLLKGVWRLRDVNATKLNKVSLIKYRSARVWSDDVLEMIRFSPLVLITQQSCWMPLV